jgi:hypothetical protein
MKTAILKPFSSRIKQLIKIHGDIWNIIESRHIECFNSIGIMIESLDGKHSRWVKPEFLTIKPAECC